MKDHFSALRVERQKTNGTFTASIRDCTIEELPPGDTVIRIAWSSLNYKDALSLTGHPGVTRLYPHTPGIDAMGTVVHSSAPHLQPGTPVIVHGYDLGMNTWGAFSEMIRVPSEWVVPLPAPLTLRAAAAYGTAGFTAALAVRELERHQTGRTIVVSGASGGVGTVAVAMASSRGFSVAAATGKAEDPEVRQTLSALGAAEIIPRQLLEKDGTAERPLVTGKWDGAIDTCGGAALTGIIKAGTYHATVTACGLTGGSDLPLTVYPFILRGLRLIGIDSAQTPLDERRAVWQEIAGPLRQPQIEADVAEVSLRDVPAVAEAILKGSHRGRTVVRIE